jgi:uncharacterized membrane protein YbhN (UPF0104 family)
MDVDKTDSREPASLTHGRAERREVAQSFFAGQFWFIFRNVVGWILIFASPVVGFLPGPGGILVFIIGFALASIPGKRRITTRVMRGKPIRINQTSLVVLTTLLSIAACAAIVFTYRAHLDAVVRWLEITDDDYERVFALIIGTSLLAIPVSWLFIKIALLVINFMLRTLPFARRYARPWLAKRGVRFLPSRRKSDANEILQISASNQKRVVAIWQWTYRWARRAAIIGLTVWIFYAILKPVWFAWPETSARLKTISPTDIIISASMFAAFLVLRGFLWRAVLIGLGHRIPAMPALRAWITSEVTRYVPGAIWQVVSRVAMIKPWGVRGSVVSTSQVLELAIFVLANIVMAIVTLAWVGFGRMDGLARFWMGFAMATAPMLALILHPSIFNRVTNWILRRLGKPPLATRVSLRRLLALMMVYLGGLVWQSAAIWLLLRGPLQLEPHHLPIVAGAYSLAWTAGFIAVWAPGGLGVREAVLIAAMKLVLPATIRLDIEDTSVLEAISVLLRVWTILGEIIVFVVAWLFGSGQVPAGSAMQDEEEEPADKQRQQQPQ